MSNDDGWWARHLGQAPQQRQQAPQYPPTQYAPQPQYAPQGPPQYQQAPQGYQQAPPQGYPGYQPPLTIDNFFEQATTWQGGQATKTETMPCPNCGGNHFFSRTNGQVTRGPQPAPMCADCGFNGMFQQGDPAVWNAVGGG